MIDLLPVTQQRLVDKMVQIVARSIGADCDFVLIVKRGGEPSLVMTEVEPERARAMLIDALHQPDQP